MADESRKRLAPAVLLVAIVAGLGAIAQPDGAADRDALYAAHRDEDGRFRTPWAEARRSLLALLRWQLSPSAYAGVEAPPTPVVDNDGRYLADPTAPPSLTWVGHATWVVHDAGDVFLTDPHFTQRALLPARLVPPGLPMDVIPADAFAVVSHNHYDHLDEGTVEGLAATVGWYVPLGLADWFRDRGRRDVTELDWWESADRGRWRITCLPSQHWSRRLGMGENETLWCAWLIESEARRYFFAGDTGYFHGFAEFGRVHPEIDAAMLPIGAYAPRWFMRYQHMDPSEAYRAFRDLGARYLLAMHWGTFDLTDEPPGYPPVELAAAVAHADGDPERVKVLAVGERFVLPPRDPGSEAGVR